MSRTLSPRRWRPRRLLALFALSLVGGTVAAPLIGFDVARAQDPFSYSIEIQPAGPYADGQAFTVVVHGAPGMRVANTGFCHPDLAAPTNQEQLTEWCTSTVGNGQVGGTAPADPDGNAELVVRAGVGNARKEAPALGTDHRWICDPTSPCRLSLVVYPPTGPAFFDTSVVLTYRDDEANAACAGSGTDALVTAAPDRLTEAWVGWTIDSCKGTGPATTASFTNDGSSLAQLAAGSVDLAYGGAPAGATGFPATPSVVRTPIALNAAVLAVAGYYPAASSVPGTDLYRRIDDIRMTNDEAAAILSGNLNLREDLQESLIARNPQLAVQGLKVGITLPSTLAGAQATTWLTSRLLENRVGASWAYPKSISKFGELAGTPLGTFADYNTLTNNLAIANLSTGKPQLVGEIYKKLAEKPQGVSLVTFYLTDLATARQLGLAPVVLQDRKGAWVAPNADSLTAAAGSMTAQPDGSLLPNPGDVAGGYPLTFVEYAQTSATTLFGDGCTPDTGRTDRVRGWVGYLLDGGQRTLAASALVPLPGALHTAAQATVAKIGATAPTDGPCAPATTTTTAPTTTTTAPVTTTTLPGGYVPGGSGPIGSFGGGGYGPSGLGTGGTFGSGGTGLGAGTGTGDLGTGTTGRARTPSTTTTRKAADASTSSVPKLPAAVGNGLFLSIAALPALVGVASATGWLSGGRPKRPVVR
jgi:hypothetical protein